MKARSGFTLLELMITVTILAVLAVVAMTSYKYYIRSARAEEAKEMLLGVKMAQAQYFSTFSQYVSTGSAETALFPAKHAKLASGGDDNLMWDWSADLGNCKSPTTTALGWCHLAFQPQGPTYFRAITIGWDKAKGTTAPSSGYEIV